MTQDNNPLGNCTFMPNARDHEDYGIINSFTLLEHIGPLREIFDTNPVFTPRIEGNE